jgi:hypothetical protein
MKTAVRRRSKACNPWGVMERGRQVLTKDGASVVVWNTQV